MVASSLHQLAEALQTDAAVLATVVQVRGSVPREVGAKMVICADGRIFNTIGGGAGEAKVIRQAMQVLATGENQLVEIDLSGAPQREVQGICGGWMQVWLGLWQGETAIALIHQILQHLETGQPITLITPLDPQRSPYLLPLHTPHRSAERSHRSPPPHAPFLFTELLPPPPTLLIVGAGHVGEQLAKVAHLIGFQVMIQDDRPEWANDQRYPQAAKIFATPIQPAIAHLASHTQLYAALVTRSYQYDLEALQALLQRHIPCVYLGMIGSKKRVQQVYAAIAQAGISPRMLESIHAPIGLEIGALTPEEIAVSIAAELIQVRRIGDTLCKTRECLNNE